MKNEEEIMKSRSLFISISLVYILLLTGCASLNTRLNIPMKSSIQGKRIVVLPFSDPYFKGRQIQGVGEPFASVFVNKLQAAGVAAELSKSREFSSISMVDIEKACKYAANNNYDMLITGTITEWIDGATQWSGTVDVAGLSVNLYTSKTCELTGSASGRQSGTWFTFVNAPTTRFFEPLSQTIVETLLK